LHDCCNCFSAAVEATRPVPAAAKSAAAPAPAEPLMAIAAAELPPPALGLLLAARSVTPLFLFQQGDHERGLGIGLTMGHPPLKNLAQLGQLKQALSLPRSPGHNPLNPRLPPPGNR
jgi:hypothetical protein